jgi:hypothetical protein
MNGPTYLDRSRNQGVAIRGHNLPRGLSRTPILAVVAVFVMASACSEIERYTVTLSTVEDCVIRANGEFCDEEDTLPPPTVQIWGVSELTDATVLYIADETWLAQGINDERTATKEERQTRNGCTTTTTRTLSFDVSSEGLVGTFEHKVRTEGPETCGDTPFGARAFFSVVGEPGALF